ncbi:MAG: cyclic pyranopterin monophosphate synthase MoaC [Thermoplasmatota archaeon]
MMIDIGAKPVVDRKAVASGFLRLRPATIRAIREGKVPKGDPLHTAETAALVAAKETPRLLPHCHPIPLTFIEPNVTLEHGGVRARVTVKAQWRTGVEMEALTATTIALLTVWDMVKALEKDERGQYPDATISDVRVEHKEKSVAKSARSSSPAGPQNGAGPGVVPRRSAASQRPSARARERGGRA